MSSDFLPYLLLLISVLAGLAGKTRSSLALLLAAALCALSIGRLGFAAISLSSALLFAIWLPTRPKTNRKTQFLSYSVFLILAILCSLHLAPGFRNLLVFDKIQFSSDSIPFTMYLNFDKTLVGLALLLFYVRFNQKAGASKVLFLTTLFTLAALILTLLPLSLLMGYVRFDPKFPEQIWLWALNNLFFVCLAEECLFRGFIQKGAQKLLPKGHAASFVAIALGAVLFGAAHYKGGPAYVGLATIAGLFYGFAYQRTGRIEASMLVHFGLNSIHFLFFSYPALNGSGI